MVIDVLSGATVRVDDAVGFGPEDVAGTTCWSVPVSFIG
jgi:hypothetical protein